MRVPPILIVVLLLCCQAAAGRAADIILDDFSNGLDPHWQEKSFAGSTRYTVVSEGGRACLQAVSKQSASGLYYEIEYDPLEFPAITWSWKIDHVLTRGNGRLRQGDDYAARLYVVFPSFFFWKTRALNYVWANRIPKGTFFPNAFTDQAMMIAIKSGPALAGQWVVESRNIYEDFKRAFGEEPPQVGAIAIMTDTDNTGQEAQACYGPIRLQRNGATPPGAQGKAGTN